MAGKRFLHALLQGLDAARRGKSEVEKNFQLSGNHVKGASATVNVRDLPRGWRKIFVALIPLRLRQLCKSRSEQMYRVGSEMRVSNMALHPFDDEFCRQRAASAIFDRIADFFVRGWFADNAVVEL